MVWVRRCFRRPQQLEYEAPQMDMETPARGPFTPAPATRQPRQIFLAARPLSEGESCAKKS